MHSTNAAGLHEGARIRTLSQLRQNQDGSPHHGMLPRLSELARGNPSQVRAQSLKPRKSSVLRTQEPRHRQRLPHHVDLLHRRAGAAVAAHAADGDRRRLWSRCVPRHELRRDSAVTYRHDPAPSSGVVGHGSACAHVSHRRANRARGPASFWHGGDLIARLPPAKPTVSPRQSTGSSRGAPQTGRESIDSRP